MTDLAATPAPGATPSPDQSGRVTFSLYAPGKERVSVIGDFNGWSADADALEPGDDGWWRLDKELGDGEHHYQYVVDGKTVVDPYAKEVAPMEGQELPHGVVRVGAKPYAWNEDGFRRPAWRDLVIYELHFADFTAEGTIAAATEKLDELKELGINAIEVLPPMQNALAEGWGYQPQYPFAMRVSYGTAEDFKRFVDEAHRRGIAVILDVVLAHTAAACPFNELFAYDESPYYGAGIGGTNEFGLPTLDHRKPATQAYAREFQRYWLQEFHLDGLRYDYAINIAADEHGNGMPRLTREAREAREGVYLIGEHLPENGGFVEHGLDGMWHLRASFAIKALAMQGDYRGAAWGEFGKLVRFGDAGHEEYRAATHMINYLESHDEERLVHELRDAGASGLEARDRVAMAATMLLTSAGVPMLYMGQEFGEDTHLATNERNPLRRDLLATEGGRLLREHYRKLIAFRHEHPALRGDHTKVEGEHGDEKWVVIHRWDDGGDGVIVAANFGVEPRHAKAPLPKGKWRDLFSDRVIEGDQLDVELRPSEALVLSRA